MEREDFNSPQRHGLWPPPDEWEWLWRHLTFLPRIRSFWPYDISGFTFNLTVGPTNAPWPQLSSNRFGCATNVQNSGGVDYAKGWQYAAPDLLGIATGCHLLRPWKHWTLAVGWRRNTYHAFAAKMISIYDYQSQWFLRLLSTGALKWDYLTSSLQTPDGTASTAAWGPTQSVVVTTRHGIDTRIYYNGKQVASATWGVEMRRWRLFYIGAGYLAKDNECLGAAYGPVLMTKNCWSQAQVAQWAADPWGFIAPAWSEAPIQSSVEFDWRSVPSIEASTRTKSATEGATRTGAGIEGSIRSRTGIEHDSRTRPSIEGSVRTRRD